MTSIFPTTDGNLRIETRPLQPDEVCRIEADGDVQSQGWATLDEEGARMLFWRLGELIGVFLCDPGYEWARSREKRILRSYVDEMR